MKHILEFDFDKEDSSTERLDFKTATKAKELSLIIWEILQHLRDARKYEHRENVNIEELEKFIYTISEDYGVDIDELIY